MKVVKTVHPSTVTNNRKTRNSTKTNKSVSATNFSLGVITPFACDCTNKNVWSRNLKSVATGTRGKNDEAIFLDCVTLMYVCGVCCYDHFITRRSALWFGRVRKLSEHAFL